MTATEVLVPIKAFKYAKSRLSDTISDYQRSQLMKRMAYNVLSAAGGLPTWVVCDNDAVATWATNVGTSVLFQSAVDLNETIQLAVEQRRLEGVRRVIVAHGDLPLLSKLERFSDVDGVVAVAGQTDFGTKVLSVPTTDGFRFSYGQSSVIAHSSEAKRCNLAFKTIRDPEMGFDINTPEDLYRLKQEHPDAFRHLTNNLNISNPQLKLLQGEI